MSEDELLNKYPSLKDVFELLRVELQKDGARPYTTANAIRFKKNRRFAVAHFREKHITLELKVGQRGIMQYFWKSHPPEWGWVNIYIDRVPPIPQEVVGWIGKAREFAAKD
jgi:hypothetical protein